MKWLRTIVVFSKGTVIESDDWRAIHESYVRSIQAIDNPAGTGTLTIRAIEFYMSGGKKKSRRNGVGLLRKRFLEHIVKAENWTSESQVLVEQKVERVRKTFALYPSGESHEETEGAKFGHFDFLTTGRGGHKVAIEWETGNVSSSHRALNKLCICLEKGIISAGVLIVPSRLLYSHITDRIGNIFELNPYLPFWQNVGDTVNKGLLVISVVEHDSLTTDQAFPYLKVGADGNADKSETLE
jgi:hypothetical protein